MVDTSLNTHSTNISVILCWFYETNMCLWSPLLSSHLPFKSQYLVPPDVHFNSNLTCIKHFHPVLYLAVQGRFDFSRCSCWISELFCNFVISYVFSWSVLVKSLKVFVLSKLYCSFSVTNVIGSPKERPKLVDPNMFLPFVQLLENENMDIKHGNKAIFTLYGSSYRIGPLLFLLWQLGKVTHMW